MLSSPSERGSRRTPERDPQQAERAIEQRVRWRTCPMASRAGSADRPNPDCRSADPGLVRRARSRSAVAAAGRDPWAIMVSEFMLQQTRSSGYAARGRRGCSGGRRLIAGRRVAGDAVRAWGRPGYPRRALRLHQAAQMIKNDFDGQVPRRSRVPAETARSRLVHSGGHRELRVRSARDRARHECPPPAEPDWFMGSRTPIGFDERERALAEELAPRNSQRAAHWAIASMELGALLCRARNPSL